MGDTQMMAMQALREQHPMMGIMADTYEKLGGDDWFLEWAQDHETLFVKLMFGMVPRVQPVSALQGDINLHVHHTLGPTELDVVSDQ